MAKIKIILLKIIKNLSNGTFQVKVVAVNRIKIKYKYPKLKLLKHELIKNKAVNINSIFKSFFNSFLFFIVKIKEEINNSIYFIKIYTLLLFVPNNNVSLEVYIKRNKRK